MRAAEALLDLCAVIGAASTMRPCAALPVSSPTTMNGSRDSGEVGSIFPPRPLASVKDPVPRFFATRSG